MTTLAHGILQTEIAAERSPRFQGPNAPDPVSRWFQQLKQDPDCAVFGRCPVEAYDS